MSPDAELAAVAQRQHALLTSVQARGTLTKRQIDGRLARGQWEPRRRNVYAIAGAPRTERQAVLAAQLAAGDAAASHLTAARLWGLRFPEPRAIHLLGPRRRLEGVRSHQSESLRERDVTQLGAIRLTTPARTIIDCSGSVPADQLGVLVDDALRRGLVRFHDLQEGLEVVATGPGRRPTVALSEVLLARPDANGPGDSAPEADIVALLTARGAPAPVLGHRARVGRHRYKLDIAWPESLVAIEFDSWEFHRTFTSFHRDRERHRRLVSAGWTVLLVTAQTDLDELVADVLRLVSWRAATA